MGETRVQVGIVGAGPAGLFLSHLLHLSGIDNVVVETRTRDRIEGRIRAGVLEQGTADLMRETGIGDRLDREGLVHEGIHLAFAGAIHRIDFQDLVDQSVVVYGQHEVVRDLVAARLAAGGRIEFGVENTSVHDLDGERPTIRYRQGGEEHTLGCDFVAGCDGFHGICRPAVPEGRLTTFERVYPFGWLGILAHCPPASEELVYARHDDGFALLSMRSPEVSRLYLQCGPDEDPAAWPDDRVWAELHKRLESGLDLRVREGEVFQKGVTAMRSFVTEPMQYGRLFLAGDAAHIVPPTGAKGMNLAVADVRTLARAFERFYRSGSREGLDSYSRLCLRRIWKVQRFSWWMTQMLHVFPDAPAFDGRRQLAELDYVTSSRAAARTLAENYVGLPFEDE